MKKKLRILIGTMLVLSVQAAAKKQEGIYMNAADYKDNKIAYENDCVTGKRHHNLHLHDFFWNSSYITVVTNGARHKLKKSALYGFRNCNDEVYRFYKGDAYRLAEAGGIYIYTQTRNMALNKGFKIVTVYYFSQSADDGIVPLTLCNLRGAYRNNEKFLEALNEFCGGHTAEEYDAEKKTFRVNYLYANSTK